MIDDHLSSNAIVVSGVPQESAVGPHLLMIFIDNLPDVVQNSIYFIVDDYILCY